MSWVLPQRRLTKNLSTRICILARARLVVSNKGKLKKGQIMSLAVAARLEGHTDAVLCVEAR